MSKLTVIIPVYFSADTLMDCYLDVKEKALSKILDYELILVDDGSGDSSYEIMKQIAALDDKVKIIKLSRNFGSHSAIFAGLCESTGDCATIKAADCQEPSELILDMYESWKQGNKVILAEREGRNDGSLFITLYYALVRKFVSKAMPKSGFDCYLIDRNVIEALKNLDEPNSALTLQILWTGFKTATISYKRLERNAGKSRWTLTKKINLVIDSFVGFSYLPIRIVTALGMCCFFGSILWGILLVIGKLSGTIVPEGWTTLAVIILLSSGMIMFSLGILGEYIWRILDAARGRPVYLVDKQKYKDETPHKDSAKTTAESEETKIAES